MLFANFLNQQQNDLNQTLEAVKLNVKYTLNCIKIAIVEEFYPETLEVQCKIVNKKLLGLNPDGSQVLTDYPPIYARCHFFGWGDVGATYPITKGMEGFLLFNDRELESWFINGNVNQLAYDRCHNLTDAIFVCGLHSKPNMIEFIANCLAIYYKNSIIKLAENEININTQTINITSDINQTGDITQTGNNTTIGTITANSLIDTSAFTGTFKDLNNKTVTVSNGIIKSVS